MTVKGPVGVPEPLMTKGGMNPPHRPFATFRCGSLLPKWTGVVNHDFGKWGS
jgi:hypothetical protein